MEPQKNTVQSVVFFDKTYIFSSYFPLSLFAKLISDYKRKAETTDAASAINISKSYSADSE